MSPEVPMYTFTTPEPVNLRVELWAGSITIDATDTHETTVELVPRQGDSAAQEAVDQAKVEQRGSDIDVILPKVKGGLFGTKGEVTATIRVPLTSALRLKTGSADLETDGELGHVQADSGSGDMELDHIADGQLRTGSGDIQVTTVTGALNAKCGSGDLTAGSIRGDADVNTG
ncbi:MAG: DUF4097 family beta strand repeat-containing protein, partial [Nocardioidaceae bacterium]